MLSKIAFGGGCHWCTEAVFQSLVGVLSVEQGFVAYVGDNSSFSEAVIVHFNTNDIALSLLVEIHLLTHKSTSSHSMRHKYRSAIYVFSEKDITTINSILKILQYQFDKRIITKVLRFKAFKPSEEQFKNYYLKNPQKPFCKKYIEPKLSLIFKKYGDRTILN